MSNSSSIEFLRGTLQWPEVAANPENVFHVCRRIKNLRDAAPQTPQPGTSEKIRAAESELDVAMRSGDSIRLGNAVRALRSARGEALNRFTLEQAQADFPAQ